MAESLEYLIYSYEPEECSTCKRRKYYRTKFHKTFDWDWDNCPYMTSCRYAISKSKEFSASGFTKRECWEAFNSKNNTLTEPLECAQIISLYSFFKAFSKGKVPLNGGCGYIIDNNGIETEPVVLDYQWLVDKFVENPRYKVSWYA